MALFGSNWKDEETPQEQFQDITGEDASGYSLDELKKRISRKIDDGFTGRIERNKLRDLEGEINEEP